MKQIFSLPLWFLLLVLPQNAAACSCFQTTSVEALGNADIVFRGKLVRHGWGTAVFHVDEQWKGDLGNSVELEWRDGSHGDCNGFWPDLLKVGNDLLVFGFRDSGGVYRTSICMPTKLVSDARAELRDLGPGKPPRTDGGKVKSPLVFVAEVTIVLILIIAVVACGLVRRRYSS
jgi:hypothetical protein